MLGLDVKKDFGSPGASVSGFSERLGTTKLQYAQSLTTVASARSQERTRGLAQNLDCGITYDRMKLAAFGIVLAAVLALPAAAASPETRTITVLGNGEAEPESVPGDWTLVVSVEHEKARTAIRSATASVARSHAALHAAGVRDFRTGRVSLKARSSSSPDETASFRAFVASAQIELTVPDAQRAAALLDRVRAAGVTQIYGPVASEKTSKELDRRALADAFEDAVEKANRLAAKAGATLGPAMAIEERRNEAPYDVVYGLGGPYSRLLAPSEDVYATVEVTFAIS